jgi:glycosyltransferase involved in cell wall biosynthesis
MTGAAESGANAPGPVIMVAAGELFAGAERQILALLVRLRADGYGPTLAVFHDRELAARARTLGLDTVVLPGSGVFRRPAIKHIAELVRTRDAGIVHFHGYKAALHVALARAITPFHCVVTIHGAPEFGGPLSGQLRALLYDRCERLAIRATQARIVFVTQELVKKLPGLAGKGAYAVIPNGIDPQTVTDLARPAELNPAHFNVVIVGRLDTVKGVKFAIQALQDPRIAPEVHLWIVGDGPERASLQEQISAASLDGRVGFTGFRADAAAFIAHADLLLMPSLHEGLPYTMLEALAAATPIAASRIGGLAETLEDSRTAFLFPVADVHAIAATIAKVAADPALAEQTAQRAHNELFPRFDAAIMARSYEGIYRSVG